MSQTQSTQPGRAQAAPGWRIKLGFALLIMSLAGFPALLGILALIGISGGQLATISGVLLVVSELCMIAGAAIAGKEGFAYIKATVFGYVKQYVPLPPEHVSKTRYTIGLVMFLVPLVYGWAAPYFGSYIPAHESNFLPYAVIGDVVLAISLFVLGGEFWDKLKSLFVHSAHAVFPEKRPAT